MPGPQYPDYCSFVVTFEIRKHESSNFILLFHDCFGYSGYLAFLYEFLDHFVNFHKEASWDFCSYCTESVDQLGILPFK